MTRGWPDPSLSLTCMESGCKMSSICEFTWKVTINHVSRARKSFFLILVACHDLSWPDFDPDTFLVWRLCSQSIFNSPLTLLWLSLEQKPSILPVLGFIIQKRQNLTFDLTLTRNLRSILRRSWVRKRLRGAELPSAALGDKYYPLLPYFLDTSTTTADIDAILTIPYSASVWGLLRKFHKNPSKNIGEHGVLVSSCFAILGQKAANVWRLLQWRGLKEGHWKQ